MKVTHVKIIKRIAGRCAGDWKRAFAVVLLTLSCTAGYGLTGRPVLADELDVDSDVVTVDDGSSGIEAQEPSADSQEMSAAEVTDLFVDTGEETVARTGDTLEEARLADDTLGGYGGSTVNVGHLYEINGVTVRNSDFPSEVNECWAYANNVYAKIWGVNFWSDFNGSDNMLRNLSDEEITLTPEHLMAYVTAAPAGSALRVCNSDYLHGNDIGGHSQIIISHDADGFTVFEGGLSAYPHRQEAYYTWTGYCYSRWPGRYQYIKYIKWPGAQPYSEDMVGSSALDLGVAGIEKTQVQLVKLMRNLVSLTGDMIMGKADPKELKELTKAMTKAAKAQGFGEEETESEIAAGDGLL